MNRRGLIGVALTGLTAGRLAGQQDSAGRPAAPAGADRLFDPSAVQQRAPATAADNDAEIQAIERRLKCTCGCNLDIYTCRTTDFSCTYSPALHREVLELRGQGKDAEAVIDAFVARHGELVLMAPEPRGFNLAGYLVPGTALLAVGGLLAAMLIRRSRLARLASAGATPDATGPASPGRRAHTEAAPEPAPLRPEEAEDLRRALAEVED